MSDAEQKGNGRRAEQQTVRTTIVGGRPPGAGKPLGDVPRGIEVLIKKAAVDPQFRPLLLEQRADAAKTIGLELRPSEVAMLAGIPQAQLEAIISRTRVDAKLRPILMGAAAAVMLVALGADLTGCNKEQPNQPVQKNTKEPIVCGGSRPDEPLQNSTPATTSPSPGATQGSAAGTNATINSTRPIMPVEGGSRPSRPLSIPEGTTPGSPTTTSAPTTLQQANELIEKYAQPVAAQEPTPEQRAAIDSAMKLLISEQATQGHIAIEQFVQIGPAALGDLRRLAATAPADDESYARPIAGAIARPGAYPATMAKMIIRRIQAAQREPILQELISLGDAAPAALSPKLQKTEAEAAAAQSRFNDANSALIIISRNPNRDSSAGVKERDELAAAQAAEQQVQARRDALLELKRLLALKPPAAPEAQPQPATTTVPRPLMVGGVRTDRP